jgi:hypothetical protein
VNLDATVGCVGTGEMSQVSRDMFIRLSTKDTNPPELLLFIESSVNDENINI